MSTVQDIYNISRSPGQLAFGYYSQSEILSNQIDEQAYSGQFLTFSSTNPGQFSVIKKASQSSARVIGMCPFLAEYPSSGPSGASSYSANTIAPYVKKGNLIHMLINQDVSIGEPVYIDISNSNATLLGNLTNVSSGNLALPTAVFEQNAKAGKLALISFNLPN